MNPEFWRLPGPARFIEKIRADLLDCRNAITVASPHLPDDMLTEVQRGVEGGYAGYEWHRLYNPPDLKANPATWLARHFGVELPVTATAHDFHDVDEAAGTVIVMADFPDELPLLGKWAAFAEQYAQVCRASGGSTSPRFLYHWPMPGHLPNTDLRLTLHRWDDTIDSTDILLYASLLMRRSGQSPFKRMLMGMMASRLSAGDPDLCQILCSLNLQEILKPLPHLKHYAAGKGWDGNTPASLEKGTVVLLDGMEKEHPAWLAMQGREQDIAMLVWGAQISCIMPLVEERRQELVDAVRHILKIPDHLPPDQTPDSIEEIEIGAIHYQIKHSGVRVPQAVWHLSRTLRNVRNDLAHRKPLSGDRLSDETIKALTRGLV
jgi:hypothetical protein